MVRASERDSKWSMVVDIDRCSGCQACVIACHAENNAQIDAGSAIGTRFRVPPAHSNQLNPSRGAMS